MRNLYFAIFSILLLSLNACSDPCKETYCLNNGVCVDGTCNCPEGTEGDNCENTVSTKYTGEYDVKCNGIVNIDGNEQEFIDAPATVKIYQGEKNDEIIMYVELQSIADAIPMIVDASAEVDGLEYEMRPTPEVIDVSIAGFNIGFNFIVSATGVLSDDFQELNSVVVFSGDLTGTVNCIGTKK